MLKLNQIQAIHSGMQSKVDTMQQILNKLNAEIIHIKSDGTRHDSYIKDKVAEARKPRLAEISAILGTFGERLETVKAQRIYWQNVPFILHQQVFDNDPVKDATIRQSVRTEFEAMDSKLLQLSVNSAIEDKNLPLIWQAWLVGHNRNGTPGWYGINLDEIEIPEQVEALRLIKSCEGLVMLASDLMAQASGSGLSPVRKLQTARALS
jgi:hypothetical protein